MPLSLLDAQKPALLVLTETPLFGWFDMPTPRGPERNVLERRGEPRRQEALGACSSSQLQSLPAAPPVRGSLSPPDIRCHTQTPAGLGASSRMQKNGVKGTGLLVPRCGEGRGRAPLGAAPRCTDRVPALLRSSRGLCQVPDTDQVVDGQAEDEHPAHAAWPAVSSLAQEPDRFEPAQDLL